MEFWGVQVPAGKSVKVTPEDEFVIHISQVSLGVSKSSAEQVPLYVSCGGEKLVIAVLSHKIVPHASMDLVFEKEFELSHGWEGGSVHFTGYKTELPYEDDDEDCPSCDSEDDELLAAAENGKPKIEAQTAKLAKANGAKANGKTAEPVEESDDDDDSDSDDEIDSDDSDDEMMSDGSDEEDEEEDTPVKAEVSQDAGKKRPAESATKSPQAKKAKAATPEKIGLLQNDGTKKGSQTATPTPAKQAGKAGAQTPKSGSEIKCNSCSKSFKSDGALQSHSKAKHSAK